jgi:hypothetical protein
VIHGQRHEQDYGPRYELEPDQLLRHRARAGETTTLIHVDGHGDPAPLEPAAGVSRRLRTWGQDSADESLHTAGPNNSDRDIRLDLVGPAAVGSGYGRSKESDADQSGMERVEGGGCGELNWDGPGRPRSPLWESRVMHSHAPLFRSDTAPLRDYPS